MLRRQVLALGAAFAALGAAPQVSAAEFNFKLHHFLGPNAPAHTDMLEPWAQRIEADSNGRVDIEIYPSMTLGGSPPQLFRQAADGVVDIIWTVNGYTPGLFPRSEVFELPTIFENDIESANLAIAEMFDEYLAPEYEGVHVLFNHVHAGQGLQMAEEAVRTVDQLEGKKLRVPGPTGNAVVEAMGATPVTMPVPDLPQALSTNAVDGALIPWEIIPPLQLQDVTDYQIEGPNKERFGTTVFQVSMNADRWNALPDDIKAIFEENSGEEWLREVARIWRNNDERGIELATKAGNTHIQLTEEEYDTFRQALAPVVDRWIAEHQDEFDAQALVDRARELMKKPAS